MGRRFELEHHNRAVEGEVLSIGARHAQIKMGDVSIEVELVDQQGDTLYLRAATRLFEVRRIGKDLFFVDGEVISFQAGSGGSLKRKREKRAGVVKAVMPGLVVKVLVKEGDEVDEGDPLVILEAMKMENQVKSPGKGVVKRVAVQEGKAVETGDILVEFQ